MNEVFGHLRYTSVAKLALALIVLLCTLPLAAQQGKKKKNNAANPEGPIVINAGPLTIAGEIAGDRVSNPDKQGDWPSIANAKDGSQWAVWIEWNDKDADRVLVAHRSSSGAWAAPMEIQDGNWDHYSPAITALPDGVMVFWSGQSNGNFDLFGAKVSSDGKISKPERLTSAPFSDFNARAVSDASGNVTVVWQSFRSLHSEIFARRYSQRWGPETKISNGKADDWDPSVALDRNGTAWISWDGYETGNYDVYLRSFDGRKVSEVIPMTTEPAAQFHTSVAVDSQDRVWVAWDEADRNWGKDFSEVSAAPGSHGLHYSRKIAMRVYANGRVQAPSADLAAIMNGRAARFAELPHLSFDSSGALWMVFRHWTLSQPNEIYHFYATRLSGDKWSTPVRFSQSSGHNTQHASIAQSPEGGLLVGYASDGRSATNIPKDQMHALHYNVYVSKLTKGDGPPAVTFADVQLPAPQTKPAPRARATMARNGKTYHLLMGDAHRHTDIRGHSGVDGSVLDTYRYAMDAAQLDWLGTSDHNIVTDNWPDGLRDYQWWYVQKTADIMSHAPVFIGIYSYEHSLGSPSGHRNMLFLKRGAPLRVVDRVNHKDDNLPPNLWDWVKANVFQQPGQKLVIVPHTFGEQRQPIGSFLWDNPPFDCLLEIYQGARSSYEAWQLPAGEKRGNTQITEKGHFAQDALNRGNLYGFVSFSDHGSTHNSWACVWAPKEDREGLFDGMLARRTYAGSDEIIVKATADGHMVGEQFTAPAGKGPRIQAQIDAPNTIVRVDVVKDGKYLYTTKPNTQSTTLRFQDTDTKPGKSYYYIRVFETDAENPQGDPEVAWTSPWFVTYR
jgi:hypothetical protein